MSNRKPQIAYAPVDPTGEIEVDCVRQSKQDAEAAFDAKHGEHSWINAEVTDGWCIYRVRIEIMGADIYLKSVHDACIAKHEPAFTAAVAERDSFPRDSAEAKAVQPRVHAAHEAMYSEGYFRDSYNSSSLYAVIGRSWWKDYDLVEKDEWCDAEGDVKPEFKAEQLAAHRAYLDAFKRHRAEYEAMIDKLPGDEPHSTAEEVRTYFRDKLDRWIKLQEQAAALGEPLVWSV